MAFPEGTEACENYLSPFTPPDLRLKGGRGLLRTRADARELNRHVFGEPPPNDPTPAEAKAMREAEEARIEEIRAAVAGLSHPANPRPLPDIEDLTGLGLGGRGQGEE